MSQAYSVRPRDGIGRVRIFEEPGAEAAAAFLEDETSVIVRELETGHEHCFRVDLETGEAKPCGCPPYSAAAMAAE